jgi:hypothetical protein
MCADVTHMWHEGDTMARVHKSYRLDEETVERVAAWADEHHVTVTQAMEQLLSTALDAGDAEEERAEGDAGVRAMLEDHIKTLKTQLDVLNTQLTTQLEAKDRQIAEKDEQLRRAHELADHSQMLQAAQVRGQLVEGVAAIDKYDGQQHTSWRKRLARWIAGGEE